MGVYLLLAVSGLALTSSFLHTGDSDHGEAISIDFVKELEALKQEQLKMKIMLLEKFDAQTEGLKESWQNEKLQWEIEKQDLKESVAQLKDHLKSFQIKTTAENRKTSDSQTGDADSSNTHEVMSRADDTGAWESVIGQMTQQLTKMSAELQVAKNVNVQQDQAIQESRASVFVRWGRTTCPNSGSLVYSGVVGGSWYDHLGAAADYLCLSMTPVFSYHPLPRNQAYLYGGEYETYDAHEDQNPPCAVCRTPRPTTMMVPGTNQCPAGWTLEYAGYLMTGGYSYHAASEYICVDINMEDRPSGQANEEGKLMYFTVTQCGSLPCPPYVNNKIATCAVCSK